MMNRTETEILLSMLDKANEMNFFTTDENTKQRIREGQITENQYVMDLSIHAYPLSEIQDKLNSVTRNIDLNTADGEGLDRMGRLVNVARYPAQAARVMLTIDVLFPIAEPVTIPAGTQVLFNDAGQKDDGMYVTMENVDIPVNTRFATVTAECTELGYRKEVTKGAVEGLEGFGTFHVTNNEKGTTGRNIEEDDSYRERIRSWGAGNLLGTRAFLTNYLNHYDGIDSYHLIPLWDGVGSLKIVCDTIPELLPQIQSDVQENCMHLTDKEVVVVLPEEYVLHSFVVYIHPRTTVSSQSYEELKQKVMMQCNVFVEGGSDIAGRTRQGLMIGQDFAPSEMITYLQGQFPELLNIRCNHQEVIPIDDLSVLKIGDINVVIE